MELWQIAAAFGLHHDGSPAGGGGTPVRSGRGRDLVRERIMAARGLAPEPVPDPPDPAVFALAQQLTGK